MTPNKNKQNNFIQIEGFRINIHEITYYSTLSGYLYIKLGNGSTFSFDISIAAKLDSIVGVTKLK